MEFICAFCMYVKMNPDMDEEDIESTRLLTVINGQMACLRHVEAAAVGNHSMGIRVAEEIEQRTN